MNEEKQKEKKEIILAEDRGFKGVWIPEKLYLTRQFSPNEKFVLVEIYSLTKLKIKKCFASNRHFADFVGLKENSIQKMMLKFEKAGYIKRTYEYREGTKEIQNRALILTDKFYRDFINEQEKPDEEGMEKNPLGGGFNSDESMEKNQQCDGKNVGDKYNINKNTINSKANSFFVKKVGEWNNFHNPPEINQEELKQRIYDVAEDARIDLLPDNQADNVERCIFYFIDRYAEVFGQKHPQITERTIYSVIANITGSSHFDRGEFTTYFQPLVSDDEDDDSYEEIIDMYFQTEFSQDVDYSIVHFSQAGVLTKLMGHATEKTWFYNSSI